MMLRLLNRLGELLGVRRTCSYREAAPFCAFRNCCVLFSWYFTMQRMSREGSFGFSFVFGKCFYSSRVMIHDDFDVFGSNLTIQRVFLPNTSLLTFSRVNGPAD